MKNLKSISGNGKVKSKKGSSLQELIFYTCANKIKTQFNAKVHILNELSQNGWL